MKCSFIQADLRGARLAGATFTGCILNGARFDGVDLRDVRIVGCQVDGARFDGAIVGASTFTATDRSFAVGLAR